MLVPTSGTSPTGRYRRRIPAEHALHPAARREPGRSLALAARSADAIVVASPLYHNSYSGVVKNALDHLSTGEFDGKPLGLIGHCGHLTNPQALDQLRVVARALGALAVPQQVFTTDADWRFVDGGYELAGVRVARRIDRFVEALLDLVACLGRRSIGASQDGREVMAGKLR